MQRSWAYLFYDLALLVAQLLPLALAVALINERLTAATIYTLVLVGVGVLSVCVARLSGMSLGNYFDSFSNRADR